MGKQEEKLRIKKIKKLVTESKEKRQDRVKNGPNTNEKVIPLKNKKKKEEAKLKFEYDQIDR